MVRQTLPLYGRVVGGCCAGGSKASCCQHVERAALRDFMLLWCSWLPLSWAAESWVLCGREAAARIAAARCGWGVPFGMCSDRVPPGTDCGERVCGAARVYFAESGLGPCERWWTRLGKLCVCNVSMLTFSNPRLRTHSKHPKYDALGRGLPPVER